MMMAAQQPQQAHAEAATSKPSQDVDQPEVATAKPSQDLEDPVDALSAAIKAFSLAHPAPLGCPLAADAPPSLEAIAKAIASGKIKHVVVLTGAGISVNAKLPDFRSEDGIFARMAKEYKLEKPEQMFHLDYFKEHPGVFLRSCETLMSGTFEPTVSHYFIRLLQEKGLLLRCFTQNIDMLHTKSGIDDELLVEAHGSFKSACCVKCSCSHSIERVRKAMLEGAVPRCGWNKCKGLVKPDVVLYGEPLPRRFANCARTDFKAGKCDLLIVIGTSLLVEPFRSLIEFPVDECPRLLICKEPAGQRLVPKHRESVPIFPCLCGTT